MKPKVIIITMGLSRIVKPIVEQHNIVGIIECAPRNKSKNINKIIKILKTFYSLFNPLKKTLKSYTTSKKIPYYYMENGCDINLENWVKDKQPDVIVVYSMSQLLKENIFNIPKYKTINLHPAYLPKYRGPFPDFWQYYNMDLVGGVTVHYIDKGEDTGDIIYQEEYDIPLGTKSPDNNDLAIGKIGVKLLLKALDNIDDLPRIPQPQVSPTPRARNIKPEEHKNIIDWETWQTERIWHILRGTELWLNAIEQPKGVYKGQRWTIENYEKCELVPHYIPSKIYTENKKKFIATKDGKIYISIHFNMKNLIFYIISGRRK